MLRYWGGEISPRKKKKKTLKDSNNTLNGFNNAEDIFMQNYPKI